MEQCNEDGIVVTLHRQDDESKRRAVFCYAAHTAAALARLAKDRLEPVAELPRHWRAP